MSELIVLNIVLILVAAGLGFFFGPDDFGNKSRAFFAVWAGWAVFCLSIVAWGIYVAIHFISKYW